MTRTPLVVRPIDEGDKWSVTIGKGEQVSVNDLRSESLEESVEWMSEQMRPLTLVLKANAVKGSEDARYIYNVESNDEYWSTGFWTNEHAAPLSLEPATDGDWVVMKGSHSILKVFDEKNKGKDWMTSNMKKEYASGAISRTMDYDFQWFLPSSVYWEEWI